VEWRACTRDTHYARIGKRDRTKMASSEASTLVNASKRIYCDHCDDYVSRATYFRHIKRGTEHEDETDRSSTLTEADSDSEVESRDTSPLHENLAEVGERDEDDASNSEGDKNCLCGIG